MINDPPAPTDERIGPELPEAHEIVDWVLFGVLSAALLGLALRRSRYFPRLVHLLQIIKIISYVSLPLTQLILIRNASFMSLTLFYDASAYYAVNWLVFLGSSGGSLATDKLSRWRKMLVLTPLHSLIKVLIFGLLFVL